MKSDIIIIGGGASGLMAAYGAARALVNAGSDGSVTVLEKMPRPARKIMITGKGRCNFTNLKDWNEFSVHVRTSPAFVKNSFYNFPPRSVISFFEEHGMRTVVERGDRAFPASYHASDVVDTLVNACLSLGVKIVPECEVRAVECLEGDGWRFSLGCADGSTWICRKLVVGTGGLSYQGTGSTGDGYIWAQKAGHSICPTFPSLTALVPRGYKLPENARGHIDRSTELSALGQALCGIQLKNVGLTLFIGGNAAQEEFGDLDFTDGGMEGPIGFQVSRKAVKAMTNGSRVSASIDLKPGVELPELTARMKELWAQVDKDPRSVRLHEKEKCRILLGKLMPWELIEPFRLCNPGITTLERRGRTDSKLWVNLPVIASALKDWSFDIAGYVGYERAVVTAGGVDTGEVLPKTLESRLCPGLYFCGEVLDVDCDTGGYNLQCAFSTGMLAGEGAARAIVSAR